MPHTYVTNLVHCAFSTKDRANLIHADLQEPLYAYFVGIGKNLEIEILALGGTENHVHILLALPCEAASFVCDSGHPGKLLAVDGGKRSPIFMARRIWCIQRQYIASSIR